jgi:hypothetical protein
MDEFQRRWQACAARARRAVPPEASAPFGFATRVLSAARTAGAAGLSPEQLWQRLTWISLAGVLAVVVALAIAEIPHWKSRSPFEPGIEDTVGQLVWSL